MKRWTHVHMFIHPMTIVLIPC